MKEFTKIIKHLGFLGFGISQTVISSEFAVHLKDWLESGYNGQMSWIKRDPEKRISAENLLAGARSVLCFLYPTPIGKIRFPNRARFAQGEDYHAAVKEKLQKIVDEFLKPNFKDIRTKICVDTSPILEKAFAVSAGLGFIGKNTLLIHPKYGSNFVLGEIVVDIDLYNIPLLCKEGQGELDFLPLPASPYKGEGVCQSCQKCVDACPTGALVKPYVLDVNRCISYLSLEHKGEVPEEFKKFVDDKTYGCDICQNACPFNVSS